MKRPIFIVAFLAVAGTASGQPAGWLPDRQHAAVVERDLLVTFPEGSQVDLALESFRSPEPGAQLIQWTLEVGVEDAGGYVRHRIEDLRTTVEAIASGGGTVRTLHWSEKADAKQLWVEALLEWIDDDTGIQSMTRAIWVRPRSVASIREHRVECVVASDAAEPLRAACAEALAQLAVTPLGEREPFAAATAEPPEQIADGDEMRPTPEGIPPVLATVEPKREEPRDLRPFYIGGFLLLVLAVLWWSRKRNAEAIARAERAEAKLSGTPEEPAEPLADEEKEDARD